MLSWVVSWGVVSWVNVMGLLEKPPVQTMGVMRVGSSDIGQADPLLVLKF